MPNHTFSTMLVATDFSAASDEALQAAIDAGTRLRSRIEVIHVIDSALELLPAAGLPFGSVERGGPPVHILDELESRAARVRRAGLACETQMREGSADVEIVRRAAEIDADLIVVGTHGRAGLAHVVLGSVAERVVQHAGRPVLTVPLPGRAA